MSGGTLPVQAPWLTGYGLLFISACCASTGQVLFKLGAANRKALLDLVNAQVIGGGLFYAVSTLLWIFALTRLPLSRAYPFTVLTFVLVYLASVTLLGERPPLGAVAGVGLVLIGLAAILWSR